MPGNDGLYASICRALDTRRVEWGFEPHAEANEAFRKGFREGGHKATLLEVKKAHRMLLAMSKQAVESR